MPGTADISQVMSERRMIRLGAITLAVSGLLFLLYPAVRPWHDESTVPGAMASMSSNAWVVAHLFAMLSLILMPLGLLALVRLADGRRSFGLMLAGTVTIWLGAGLALPYYGAEDFALHAIARNVGSGASLDLLALVDAVRFGTVAATTFAIGLGLLGVGGVLLAIAIWRGGIRPRWSGVPLAIALLLLIPQFYLPPWARIGHGVLVALALLWLAAALWTAASEKIRPLDRSPEIDSITADLS
jgi:hypothetical protein